MNFGIVKYASVLDLAQDYHGHCIDAGVRECYIIDTDYTAILAQGAQKLAGKGAKRALNDWDLVELALGAAGAAATYGLMLLGDETGAFCVFRKTVNLAKVPRASVEAYAADIVLNNINLDFASFFSKLQDAYDGRGNCGAKGEKPLALFKTTGLEEFPKALVNLFSPHDTLEARCQPFEFEAIGNPYLGDVLTITEETQVEVLDDILKEKGCGGISDCVAVDDRDARLWEINPYASVASNLAGQKTKEHANFVL